MKLSYPKGSTILEKGEIEDLIPAISTQEELNEYEKLNISIGLEWARKSRKIKKDLLTISGLRKLHKEMFQDVWKWAGSFRSTEKNIGVLTHNIQQDLHNLCEDTKAWIQYKTYSWDEIGIRFHHRLTVVHAFPNGNGRHARIAADLLMEFNKHKPFSWGGKELNTESDFRTNYLNALKKADEHNYNDLIIFGRS